MNRASNLLIRSLAVAACLLSLSLLAGCQGESRPKETTTAPTPGANQNHPAGAQLLPAAPGANQVH